MSQPNEHSRAPPSTSPASGGAPSSHSTGASTSPRRALRPFRRIPAFFRESPRSPSARAFRAPELISHIFSSFNGPCRAPVAPRGALSVAVRTSARAARRPLPIGSLLFSTTNPDMAIPPIPSPPPNMMPRARRCRLPPARVAACYCSFRQSVYPNRCAVRRRTPPWCEGWWPPRQLDAPRVHRVPRRSVPVWHVLEEYH